MLSRLARLAGAIVLSLAAGSAFAQTPAPRMIGGLNVANLCSAVDTKAYELDPFHDTILYQYQTLLYRAAGVQAADSQAVVNQKLRSFMNAHLPEMQCNMLNFSPRNGNILKMAVARQQTNEFLYDAADVWKIDLNLVDPVDGFTVLDYAEQRDDAYKPGRTRGFAKIYKQLRAAGARHRFEIAASGKPLPPVETTAQALTKFESKALAGDIFSAMRLADIYLDGRILNGPIPPDPAKARLWLERASALATANRDVSDMHWVGMGYGALKDRTAELRWYGKAVELALTLPKTTERIGWAESNFELGRAYAVGDGVPRNLDLALLHMGRSEKSPSNMEIHGIPVSKRWMGYIVELRGDFETAARWYRTARASGDMNYALPVSGQLLDAWLAAKGLPKCGPDIYGDKAC